MDTATLSDNFVEESDALQDAERNKNNSYLEDLNLQAYRDYPGIMAKHNPRIVVGSGKGYAETLSRTETGSPDSPRRDDIQMGRVGIEVFRTDQFSHHDLIGELLHIDPYAKKITTELQASWTPKQLETLKVLSLDYEATKREGGRSEYAAVNNATAGAIRGSVVNQWPSSNDDKLHYSDKQLDLLSKLKQYVNGEIEDPRTADEISLDEEQ